MNFARLARQNQRTHLPGRAFPMTEPTTRTLDVPGAVLHYDIRTSESTTEPPLLLFGSPMPASGFVTLASHFTDRTVVTYPPGRIAASAPMAPA